MNEGSQELFSSQETVPETQNTEDENDTDIKGETEDNVSLEIDVKENKELKDRERKEPESESESEYKESQNDKLPFPNIKCPEKIIICIDMSKEMDTNTYTMADGTQVKMMSLVKKIIRIFLYTKSTINPEHTFALVILQNSAVWICNFTSDVEKLLSEFEDACQTLDCDQFDMSNLFESILENLTLNNALLENDVYPPCVVRTIIIYGRTTTVPNLKSNCQFLKCLQAKQHFFFDVLFIHDQMADELKAQEVFDFFCELDPKYTSYIFEVSGNATKLHNNMAMLLAHPLQRPIQKSVDYKLERELLAANGEITETVNENKDNTLITSASSLKVNY